MPSLPAFCLDDTVSAEDLCLSANLDGGGLFSELRDEDFTAVQNFRMMQPRILATCKANDIHAVFFRLHDNVVRVGLVKVRFIFFQAITPHP